MSDQKQFEFALERLEYSDWAWFEKLASQFLVSDFPDIRSMGTSSGDRGRDAELFRAEGETSILFQYSVTPAWEAKIRATRARIEDEFPQARQLIYLTSQKIGAKGDSFLEKMRKGGLIIDIRDRTWFVERIHTNATRERAAKEIIELKTRPLLEGYGLVARSSSALTPVEEKTAFMYLSLQLADDVKDKNLTKLSFEALVKAALRGTDSEHRRSRKEVIASIREFLPGHNSQRVETLVTSALKRMDKNVIRHWQQDDSFCLSHAEIVRQKEAVARQAVLESEVMREIESIVNGQPVDEVQKPDLCARIRRIIDLYLLRRGEEFARAVLSDTVATLFDDELKSSFTADLLDHPSTAKNRDLYTLVKNAIISLTEVPSESVVKHLHELSATYTLMAFLRETPDVQEATKKMFGFGQVWLDTSIILPLIAETVLENDAKKITPTIIAASAFGMKFHVTCGVLEEVHRHFLKCFAYINTREPWQGGIPFLCATYAMSSRNLNSFRSWSEKFFGNTTPEEDVGEFLSEVFGIDVQDLTAEVDQAPTELRAAVQEAWQRVHDGRREVDEYDLVKTRLVRHDVENYLGVLQKRAQHRADKALGERYWWLTLDGATRDVHAALCGNPELNHPSFPVISPDFLLQYLEFGPGRGQNRNKDVKILPVLLSIGIESMPPELLAVADEAREKAAGQPEYIIRRHIRDQISSARTRMGELQKGGLKLLQNDYQGRSTSR